MAKRLQNWTGYTPEDHDVWRTLAERQVANLADKGWRTHLAGLRPAGIGSGAVPKFTELDTNLARTGWSIEVVDGIIPVEDFVELLSQRRFPSSTWLRSREQLDYLEEPDMFHDIFGHVPLLLEPTYAWFVQRLGALGVRRKNDPRAMLLLERLYWFTIEFGLIREGADLRILGAGILSSFGESNHIFDANVELRPFSVEGVLYQPFRNNEVQQLYFVIEHPDDLWRSIERADAIIEDLARGRRLEAPFRFAEQVGSATPVGSSDPA